MKKAAVLALLTVLLTMSGCSGGIKKYTDQRFELFDTVIIVTAYCQSQQEFDALSSAAFDEFARLHSLFDTHNDTGVGLSRLNALAGQGPVEVEPEVFALLETGKKGYALTHGKVNIAMGAVLKLWNDAREKALQSPEEAAIPAMDDLRAAAEHCDIDDLVLDSGDGTAELRDGQMRIDAGAVAKGYAVDLVVQRLRDLGYSDFVLSAGGNVWTEGSPPNAEGWRVGVQSPEESAGLLTTLTVSDCAVVTSGGYLRYFTVGEETYHHIIDPDTLMPADAVLSATVVCPESATADLLSTACFMLPAERGRALAAETEGVRLILLDKQGQLIQTP